jgi:four helix bundle protein
LIAEGFIRFTPEEFVHYLRMARAEMGELQTHLETARRQRLLSDEEFARVIRLTSRAMAITTRLLKSKLPLLKKKRGTTQ